jgi:hypothetical protein
VDVEPDPELDAPEELSEEVPADPFVSALGLAAGVEEEPSVFDELSPPAEAPLRLDADRLSVL